MKQLILLMCVITTIVVSGCSGTKYLQKGEKLYTGADLIFIKQGDVPKTKSLKKEVQKVIAPKPNSNFLWIARPKLWLYEVADTPKGKGLRYFMKNKIGEPPVLMSKVSPSYTLSLIKNRLENNGYFKSEVEYEVKEKKKTGKVIYTATLHTPYRIDSIKFPLPVDTLYAKILKSQDKTLLKKGDIYNLITLKAERERIDLWLKNEGYFYFNPDYLVFYADSSTGNHKVNLTLEIKDETPEKALKRYRIGDVVIDPNYSLTQDSSAKRADTMMVEGKQYIKSDSTFNPKTIVHSVFLDHGEFYSRKNHDITLRRLMGLGIFKFVSIKFDDVILRDTSFLNTRINLTPLYKKSLRAEILGISKSTNFAGPGVNLSFRNRNFLGGSELFVLSLEGGFETQIAHRTPGQPFLGSFDLSADANLYVPKFLFPFVKVKNISSYYVPKTKFSIGGERIYHLQYFTLNSAKFTFGYIWKESETKQHELDPIVINYVHTTRTTELFDSLLEANPFLRSSFEEQFIAGLEYSYTFNNQLLQSRPDQYYFKGEADFSGNALSLINQVFTGVKVNPENPEKIFGAPYSQYSRFSIDARYFHVYPKKNKLATRLIAGIGVPYGNSEVLPYIKQFFIGGSNSIRAWRARTLGPGSFLPPSEDSIGLLQQSGDIKLEMNAEYRCNLVSIIKGAAFVDAGNIWLLHNDPLRPGGLFGKDFINQLAVGTGLGLRADASFFVIRLDLAFPIRKPWLDPGNRWVINEINFGSPTWRSENLVLNIAIGYPF